MAVQVTSSKILFTGDGIVTTFPIPFEFFKAAQIRVVLRDENVTPATETPQTGSGTDFDVTGAAPGTDVEMNVAPAVGEFLLVIRVLIFEQEIDFINTGAFPSEVNETGLDFSTMLNQQLEEISNRSPFLPETLTGFDSAIPEPAGDQFIKFNAGVTAYELVTTAELIASLDDIDENIKISANDTNNDFLINKLTAAANVTLTEINDGGDEDLEIGVTGLVTTADLASNANALGASLVGIEDPAGDFTGTDVEAALTEVATDADLASNANGLGASLIGIEDVGGVFTATDVEAALDELEASIVGGSALNVVTVAIPTTLTNANDVVLVNAAVTITLQSAATATSKAYRIKAIGAVPVIIDGDGADTIDGDLTLTLTVTNSSVTLIPDGGTAWHIV